MRFRVVSAYHRRGGGRVEPGAEVTLSGRDAERLTRLGCVVPVAPAQSVAPPVEPAPMVELVAPVAAPGAADPEPAAPRPERRKPRR